MAQSKKGKVIQMLSPENYIKQKARTLPIHECFVNAHWKESKMATVIISRKHSNGNVTVGLFLVDLFCLGINDTSYRFNIPNYEFEELKGIFTDEEAIKIDYSLAHNIILAGLEFAEDYEFKPHKNFKVVQYLLEEDSDDIELMEIECGIDDKPVVLLNYYDFELEAKIRAQLERVAGEGNYIIMNQNGIVEDWDEDEDYLEEENDFEDLSYEILCNKFTELVDKGADIYSHNMVKTVSALNFHFTDENSIIESISLYFESYFVYHVENEGTLARSFGIDHDGYLNMEDNVILKDLSNSSKEFMSAKKIEKFIKQNPNNPFGYYLKGVNSIIKKDTDAHQLISKYHKQFPHFVPLTIIYLEKQIQYAKTVQLVEGYPFFPSDIFGSNKEIQDSDFELYFSFYMDVLIKEDNLNKLIGLKHYIETNKEKFNVDNYVEILFDANVEILKNKISTKPMFLPFEEE